MHRVNTPSSSSKRCGTVAMIGAPNAGKSTLLNQLLGQKLAIVSAKPQTTRTRLLGIALVRQTQIGFIDTPGIFAPRGRLDRAMVAAAWQSARDADCILLVVDAAVGRLDAKTQAIIAHVQQDQARVIVALNKTDAAVKSAILPQTQQLAAAGFEDIFMVSARTGDGVTALKRHIAAAMPTGDWLFPADQLTDMPSALVAAEMTREQLYHQLARELPYAAAVLPAGWQEKKDGSLKIVQHIVVLREGQKAIVIGKGGAQLKKLGVAARKMLETFFGRRVHLSLEVAVNPDWQEQRGFYRLFGLDGVGKN